MPKERSSNKAKGSGLPQGLAGALPQPRVPKYLPIKIKKVRKVDQEENQKLKRAIKRLEEGRIADRAALKALKEVAKPGKASASPWGQALVEKGTTKKKKSVNPVNWSDDIIG